MQKVKLKIIIWIRKWLPDFLPIVDRIKTDINSKFLTKIPAQCKKCKLYQYNPNNLVLDPSSALNDAFLDLQGHIHIGKDVFFGHQVKVLTGYHDISLFNDERRKTILSKDVVIEEGVWIIS